MIIKIICVRDRAANVYGTPYFAAALGQAIRGFADEINRNEQGNTLSQHPEDFDLYHLGEYNDQDGSFTCHAPRMIAVGKDQKRN